MTFMLGDFCDYQQMCLVLIDSFIVAGWQSVFKIGVALLATFEEELMRAADIV